MSVTHIDSGNASPHESPSRARKHRVGDQLRLTVVQRLDATHYRAAFADGWQVVKSTIQLPVGASIRATVTAVGEQLELQYVGTDAVAAAMAQQEARSEDALSQYEQRHRVVLSPSDRSVLQKAFDEGVDLEIAAASACYLSKLSLPLDSETLQTVYRSQRWDENRPSFATAADVTALRAPARHDMDRAPIEAALNQIFHGQAPSQGQAAGDLGADSDDGDRRQRRLAAELLNQQDGGSVEYRYGVLPLLIADQLFELDLVYLRDRNAGIEPAKATKRMVMTLDAPSLGRVEVAANAIGERVAVVITTESEQSQQALAAETERVREMLDRLGWKIDGIRYEFGSVGTRASTRVVEHVLNGDSVSRLV